MNAPSNKPVTFRPRLVLAYADSAHASLCCRQLRRLGWEVHLTSSGAEARRLTQSLAPHAVVLDTELRDESGWLTCAKLVRENPGQTIILVSEEITPESERFASHTGATALVRRADGATALVQEVHGTVLASAG